MPTKTVIFRVASFAILSASLVACGEGRHSPVTIENRTSAAVAISYLHDAGGPELALNVLGPGDKGGEYSVFIGSPTCLEGSLIARTGSTEVARIDHPCEGGTWVIGP